MTDTQTVPAGSPADDEERTAASGGADAGQPAARQTGAPTWMDLTTRDPEAAHAFYGGLLGWEVVEAGPDLGGYRHLRAGDAIVGGLAPAMGPDGSPTDPADVPARWSVYLAAEDVDATVSAATEAGGRVILPPMDIPGMGRTALLRDAAGAEVGLWQAGPFVGLDIPGTPGTPVWFECMSRDALVAEQFYREALGWDITVMAGSGEDGFWYATNGAEGLATAGLCDASSFLSAGDSGYWRMYVAVDSADATVERVRELGGTVLDGPIDSPFGRVATVADTEGASFQIIEQSRREG